MMAVGAIGRRRSDDSAPRAKRSRRCALCFALLGLALSSPGAPAHAQPWRAGQALELPEQLKLSVNFRTRYEYLDEQFRAGSPGSDEVLTLRTRIDARLQLLDWLMVGAEFQDSRAYLHDDNTPVGTGMVNAAELLRAYVDLAFEGPLGGRQHVQLGRMTMDVGSRRLVARNHFRNTSNGFTGFDWKWHTKSGRELRLFYTLPVQRLPNESDRLRDNDVEFDLESFDFQFAGVFLGGTLPWGDWGELYVLGLYEKESYDQTDGESIPGRRLATPGFRLMRTREAGRFDYQLESAVQVGESRSTVFGRSLDHLSHFHHLAIGYTFAHSWSPRLLVHYDYASGDEDPTDDKRERFDTLFGARRFEFGPTSLYGAFTRSNINTPGVRLELDPGPAWDAFFDYRAVWLASATDEWVPTGVRDPAGESGNFVGQQIEMRLRWNVRPGNVLLEAGYAHLFAGSFIEEAPNSNGGRDTNYVYTQVIIEL